MSSSSAFVGSTAPPGRSSAPFRRTPARSRAAAGAWRRAPGAPSGLSGERCPPRPSCRISRSANASSTERSASWGCAGERPLAALHVQIGIVSALDDLADEGFEALLLDRLADDQGVAGPKQESEVFRGDVQTPLSVANARGIDLSVPPPRVVSSALRSPRRSSRSEG